MRLTFRRDLLASFVVFRVALPLRMDLAIEPGLPAAAGLITGIVSGGVIGRLRAQSYGILREAPCPVLSV